MKLARQISPVLLLTFALAFAQAASAAECNRTPGSSDVPSESFPKSDRWLGSSALAVMLPHNGIWIGLGPAHNYRDKLAWYSQGFKLGLEENLVVTGMRLDAEAPPAVVSRASTTGAATMLLLVEFPSAGCWQITGEYMGQALTFIVEVRGA